MLIDDNPRYKSELYFLQKCQVIEQKQIYRKIDFLTKKIARDKKEPFETRTTSEIVFFRWC